MRFDPSGMTQAFDKLRDRAAAQGNTLADVQARDFLNEMKRQGRAIAPTPETLKDKAAKLGWRLKRKPGVSAGAELQRRIRARGTFARCWKIAKVESRRFLIRIWLVDDAKQSDKVDTQRGISDKAEKASGTRYKSRLDAMATNIMKGF